MNDKQKLIQRIMKWAEKHHYASDDEIKEFLNFTISECRKEFEQTVDEFFTADTEIAENIRQILKQRLKEMIEK